MGKLLSKEREIDEIEWCALHESPTPTVSAAQVNTVVVCKLAGPGRKFATNVPFLAERDLLPGRYPWLEDVLRALFELGAISQGARNRHMAVCQELFERRQRYIDMETVAIVARRYRFSLSEEQLRALETNTPLQVAA